MKYAIKDFLDSLARLFRFIAWYGIALAGVFYLLPILALFLEGRFDALSGSVKFFAVIGFFVIVAAWQIADRRDRLRSSVKTGSNPGDFHSA
jgi:hypothetical protein